MRRGCRAGAALEEKAAPLALQRAVVVGGAVELDLLHRRLGHLRLQLRLPLRHLRARVAGGEGSRGGGSRRESAPRAARACASVFSSCRLSDLRRDSSA